MVNLLFVLLFLVSLTTKSVSAVSDVNIDCGATDSYTDSNFIVWGSDDALTGESQTVQNPSSVSHELSTLRVFSTPKKNCYSVDVDKGVQVLVRAAFHYGNYDKKSSPPTFDLQLDGNHWTTVTTLLDEPVTYEAIYLPKGGSSSVCVARTKPNQLPFISSIEVRALGDGMYNEVDASYALFMVGRYAYGAQNTVRFSDDAYDRIWTPVPAATGFPAVTTSAIFINTSIPDQPPLPVLQTALTTSFASGLMILSESKLPTTAVPVYINLYFSEVAELDSTEKRSINVFIDNKIMNKKAIIPIYQGVVEYTITNISADASTTLTLAAAPDLTLRPIINALEIFTVSDVLSDGTNSNDFEGLNLLQQQFEKLREWSGDPCLPATFEWEWVACSSDPTPRITALILDGLQLKGPLPDFSAMDALQIINMRNNSINGEIPDFLGSLPNLKQLNLADNDFSGPVPSSISQNNKMKSDVSGNPNLCSSGKRCTSSNPGTSNGASSVPSSHSDGASTLPSSRKKKNKLPVLLGSLIPSVTVFSAIIGFVVFKCRRRKAAGPRKPGQTPATTMAGSAAQVYNVDVQSPIGAQQQQATANVSGQSPIGAEQQPTGNDSVIEISQQMASELHDLFQQQEQASEDNNRL